MAAEFVERGRTESLVEHMARNADALALSKEQRLVLDVAFGRYRVAGATKAEQAEANLAAAEVRAALASDMAATLQAAVARGERVDGKAYNPAGARRIKDRDGFLSLKKAGKLSEAEVIIGEAYRYLWDTAGVGGGLGSQLGGHVRGTDADACGAGLLRAYAGVRLTAISAALLDQDPTGRSLAVLQDVVGAGQPLTRETMGGNTKKANHSALHEGLAVAQRVITETKNLKRLLRIRAV